MYFFTKFNKARIIFVFTVDTYERCIFFQDLIKAKTIFVFAPDTYERCIFLQDLIKARTIAVFTPDSRILCSHVVCNGNVIVFGLYDRPELLILKLSGVNIPVFETVGSSDLFGESVGDSSEDDKTSENED